MIEKPVAIITAAGKGLGAAAAHALAKRGYRLALLSPSGSAEQLAKELGGVGMKGSVSSADDLARLVDLAQSSYGRIDAVLNNTGHVVKGAGPARGPIFDLTDESHFIDIPDGEWHTALDMIILNVVRMARLVTPLMIEQGGGVILNVSSFAAKEPSGKYPVGAALRMALAGVMKLYADRYGRHNIRMNNILPGFMGNHEMSDAVRRTVPMGRAAALEEFGNTAAFLLSPDAGYITGQSIVLDGGMNRGI